MCFEKGCTKSLRLHSNVILNKNPPRGSPFKALSTPMFFRSRPWNLKAQAWTQAQVLQTAFPRALSTEKEQTNCNKPTMLSELWEQTWARIAWCEAMQFNMQGRVQNCHSLTWSRRLVIPDNFDWWTWPSYKSTASSWIWMDPVVKRGYRDTPVRYTPVRYRKWNPTMDWFYKGVSFSRGIIVPSFHAVSLLRCKPTPQSFFYLEPICPLFCFSLKTKSLEKERFDFPTSYIHVCTYISHVSGAVPQAPRMSRSWRCQRCCHSWGSKRSSCSILDEGWLSMRRFGWLTSTSESPVGNFGATEI